MDQSSCSPLDPHLIKFSGISTFKKLKKIFFKNPQMMCNIKYIYLRVKLKTKVNPALHMWGLVKQSAPK